MPVPCKSCRAMIDFVESVKKDDGGRGRLIPVDAVARVFVDPRSSAGPRATVVTDEGHVVTGAVLDPKGPMPDLMSSGRPSHFATCPNAKQHRRGKS